MMNNNLKKHYFYLYISVIIFMSLIIYGKTVFFSFVTDDWMNIFDNSLYFSLEDIKRIFTSTQINYRDESYYRPLDTIYFLITFNLFNDNPFYYHILNIFFFIFFLILFYCYCLKKFSDRNLALILILLFLSHPINVETVSWISARNQILIGIFFVLAITFSEKIFEKGNINIFLILISGVMASLIHEIGLMVFPLVIFLVFNESVNINVAKIKKKQIILLFSFSIIVILYLYVRSLLGITLKMEHSLYERLLTSFIIFKKTIFNLVLPFNLKLYYHELVVKKSMDLEVMSSILIFVCFLTVTTFIALKNPIARVGYFFFWLTYVPFSGVFKLIDRSFISDRYLFLPFCGILIMFFAVAKKNLSNYSKYLYLVSFFIIIIFSIISFNRVDIWKNDLENAKELVREYPEEDSYRNNLAILYLNNGDLDAAEKEFLEAMKIAKYQKDYLVATEAFISIIKGNREEAKKIYLNYLNTDKYNMKINYNLGVLFLEEGDREKAKYHLELAKKEAKKYLREYPDILNNLGVIEFISGNNKNAESYFLEGLKIRPYDKRLLQNIEKIRKD